MLNVDTAMALHADVVRHIAEQELVRRRREILAARGTDDFPVAQSPGMPLACTTVTCPQIVVH